jgi:hypothetical protein
VLAIAPAQMNDPFFWRVARLAQLDYFELRCPSLGDRGSRRRLWDRNLFVDAGLLDKWLAIVCDGAA